MSNIGDVNGGGNGLVRIKTLNSSFVQLNFNEMEASQNALKTLKQTLQVERAGWQYDYMVKIGRKSKYDVFYQEYGENTLVLDSGLLDLPPVQEILQLQASETEDNPEIDEYLEDILESDILPFAPYAYQIEACRKALNKKRKLSLMCTGSGKSLTISLCLEYFRRKGLKGVLVVPNINLLTQFANDIKSYNLTELHSNIITFGGGSKKLKQLKESNQALQAGDLVITTWQSLSKLEPEFFKSIDFIICDEVHKFSSSCTSQLVQDSGFAEYKLGFTGTLPDSKSQKLTLIGLFGMPENIITSSQLIEEGRGTPIHITGVKLKHTAYTAEEFSRYGEYLDKLKIMLNAEGRNQIIANIALQASQRKEGSTLVLFTLIEHGFEIFKEIAKRKGLSVGEAVGVTPDLETMKAYGVYFMSGQSSAKDREAIRHLMDEDPEAILVANYALLSTGVNIKSLRYAIFASPVKSGVVVAQSLGRGIRLNEGKQTFNVYDIVDVVGGSGMFARQYNHRKQIYKKSNFTLDERNESL
nr:MAG TPA: DNA helicase [Caudoviricetes sp.]DAX96127.1 MAG TPA: DNA helicase [Bacteriophage sp.]